MSVPSEALESQHISYGFLPFIALHRRGGVFVQESSYSLLGMAGLMFGLAVAACFIPWNLEPIFGRIRGEYLMVAVLVWTGAVCIATYVLRNFFGLTVTIDADRKTLRIKRGEFVEEVSWSEVVEFQVCEWRSPTATRRGGYQLILARRNSAGEVKRDLLWCDASKGMVTALARRYEELFQFRVVDYARRNE